MELLEEEEYERKRKEQKTSAKNGVHIPAENKVEQSGKGPSSTPVTAVTAVEMPTEEVQCM